MYVCICNAITDRQIRDAARSGASSLWKLQKDLGVASNCGKCREVAMQIVREEALAVADAKGPGQGASSV
ncbi:MAG: (2Fe-2S)-binding protein [Woeseiaceae bacterium]|nr:(2Fe-2S)-binding protein [Woeseiaceae bacterium]NIP19821.1 (2Fe-2S)-binding protein [Woeseiaceae bacterium]NIS43256.1 bacterioferritin-associated ferredoxin [Desulfuromonadales bacterium]NIS89938.1 (2Fe-2S)-binding protein [Woeseiaceae bacterium]